MTNYSRNKVLLKTVLVPVLGISILAPLSLLAAPFCAPHIEASTPTSQFIDHNDGTVTDKSTNLMWKKCVEGLSGDQCQNGTAISVNWKQALDQPDAVNPIQDLGYSNWRVPNISELESLVEESCIEPAINKEVFPNTPSARYWSSSPSISTDAFSWDVKFDFGGTYGNHRSNVKQLRLVRDQG